jgi:hypothetical protein
MRLGAKGKNKSKSQTNKTITQIEGTGQVQKPIEHTFSGS